jgi:hypothetical protein
MAEWTEMAKSMVETLGPTLSPDDDWKPTCFLLSGKQMSIAAIDPGFMASEATKNQLTKVVLPGLIQESGADAFAMVLTAWVVAVPATPYGRAQINRETGATKLKPSLHPGRTEAVLLTLVTASESAMMSAEIVRKDGKAPTLKPWSKAPDMLSGRFIDPVRRAFGQTPTDTKQIVKKFFDRRPE